jgi:hypothetical protein
MYGENYWIVAMKISTVKIKHSSGYCLINQSDFDPDLHELYNDVSFSRLINLNTASVKDLTNLPTVSSNRANLIVENRPYESIEQAKARLSKLNWQVIENLVEV